MRQKLLILLLLSMQVYSQNYFDDLVLYLPFTGNVVDSSDNGYTVLNAGASLAADRFGNENSAYYFDGSDNMTITSSQNLPNIDSSGFTVSLWVKQDTLAADDGSILSYGNYGKGGFSIGYKTGTYYLPNVYTATGQSYSIIRIGQYDRVLEENWNMLTLTYSNGIMKSYVNGGLAEEKIVAGFASTGYNFVIGNSVTSWIDEISVYNRCLSNIEVAKLSGFSGAIRAAELNSYLLSDFEQSELNPAQYVSSWHIYGHVGDDLSYCTTLANPVKSAINTSDFCMASITFPTKCSGNLMSKETPSRKQEYTIYTEDGEMADHHHIYQWKVLMYDSTFIKIDSMMWFTNNQVTGNFQLYDNMCYPYAGEEGGIYYDGGIFNDNEKESNGSYVLNPEDRLNWFWRYRVLPDTAVVRYKYDIGKWMTWTYDIFWTKTDTGSWRLYKDGELLSSRDNVQTLPDCAPEADVLHLAHKFGQYTRWNDAIDREIDSLVVYYDDIEMYLDPENKGITIEDICKECNNSSITNINKTVTNPPVNFILMQNYPNPFNPTTSIEYQVPSSEDVVLKIYDILGREVITLVNEQKSAGKYTVKWDSRNSFGQQVSSGVYFYRLNCGGGFTEIRKMTLIR